MPIRLADWLEPHCVYRYWNAAGCLLYVGCTRDPDQRWRFHAGQYDTQWAPEITAAQVTWYPSRGYALVAEWVAIVTESPVHNRSTTLCTRINLTQS